MRRPHLAIIVTIAAIFFALVIGPSAHAQNAPGPQPGDGMIHKLCLPSRTLVGYTQACPAGTTSTRKICRDGREVAYSAACPEPVIQPNPQPSTTTYPQPTKKLCLPSNTIVSYSGSCPSGTTQTRKICPYGQEVGYTSKCPSGPTPPSTITYGATVRAAQACNSMILPATSTDFLTIGASYKVVALGGYMLPEATVQEAVVTGPKATFVVLVPLVDDGKHWGDGAFAYYVPMSCVVMP